MIKYILVSVTTLFLISCTQVNSTSDKTITQDGDTIAEMDISLSKLDAVEELSKMDDPNSDKLIFKASGAEPGWFAEFSESKIRLVFDYGKDSLIIENLGDLIKENADYKYVIKDNISISALKKPCTDAGSGDKMDRQVEVTYKGKTYKGCGSFVK